MVEISAAGEVKGLIFISSPLVCRCMSDEKKEARRRSVIITCATETEDRLQEVGKVAFERMTRVDTLQPFCLGSEYLQYHSHAFRCGCCVVGPKWALQKFDRYVFLLSFCPVN